MGKRSFPGGEQDILSNNVDDLDMNVLASLADFGQTSAFGNQASEGDGTSSVFSCYTDFGFCLSSSVMMAMKEEKVTEKDIMSNVAKGLAEYFTTGDIVNTWKQLREIKHVIMAAKCLRNLKNC